MIESRRLEDLEGVIERGLTTFVEVGNAIREIRDSKLYKDQGYETFEKYCRERWGWSRNYVNKQVTAADTAALVGTTVPIQNERVARELAPLAKEDPETAKRVWGGLTEEHGEDLTAKHVKKAVEEVRTAKRIREQLPPSTKTVVEGSDPEDSTIATNPKQLTHLSDIARKRGDDKAADVAERVANGEYKSTFDAYPGIKAELPKDEDFTLTREEDAIEKFHQRRVWYERLDLEGLTKAARTVDEAERAKEAVDGIIGECQKISKALEARIRELRTSRLKAVD